MTGRRDFLKAAAGAGTLAADKKERNADAVIGHAAARQVVRQGELGAIHFCRIADAGLRDAASYILDGAECLVEIEPDAEGTAFLGSRGTLVVRGSDWRVFSQKS